ncbi:hypothetical protein QJS04_geneDACA017304 [Acorus gramineus]|uniref:WRC domain-containing protein n=1 Tax=Acorus gramineus TaxID=55184 RepID=A0AAV9BDU3_ACOGR|nr:hypothetical protein QJS04_geneDACA017304 [Acorus gramineus]
MELAEAEAAIDNRCVKNNGGRSWRCKNYRMPGKCLCEKHYLSMVRYQGRDLALPPPSTPSDGGSVNGQNCPPDDQRCVKTNGGKFWRCKNDRLPGKNFCGRHSFRGGQPREPAPLPQIPTSVAPVGRVSVKVGTDDGEAVIVPEDDWPMERVERPRVSRRRKVAAEGSESPAAPKRRSKLRVSRKKVRKGLDGIPDGALVAEMGGPDLVRVLDEEANVAGISGADGDLGVEGMAMENGASGGVDFYGLEGGRGLEGIMHDPSVSAGMVGRFDDAFSSLETMPPSVEATTTWQIQHIRPYTHQNSSPAPPGGPTLTSCVTSASLHPGDSYIDP